MNCSCLASQATRSYDVPACKRAADSWVARVKIQEMMQEFLIIRRQVAAIRHSEKPVSMTIEEWKSIDEIARSTIRMHLAENVYFNMAKETTTLKLWEKLQVMYEKQCSSSKLILIRKLFNTKMRETETATSHINTFSRVLS